MNQTQMYRQGDVLITRVAKIPARAIKRENRGAVVLAEGEVTGHAHRIEAPEIAELYDSDRGVYLTVERATRLVHEEHGAIVLEPGAYRVARQREYTPDSIRNVAD